MTEAGIKIDSGTSQCCVRFVIASPSSPSIGRKPATRAPARELMFLSERIDARRCETLGLVNRVVPDANLQRQAFVMAELLANGPSLAFVMMKDNLDQASSLDHEAENMVSAPGTAQHKEAVAAFVEKRRPDFRNAAAG